MGELIHALYGAKCEEERALGQVVWPSRKYENDPCGFFVDVLGFAPTAAQARGAEAHVKGDRNSWVSGRRTGKSRLAAGLALFDYCLFPDATVILLAPTERQIVEVIFQDLKSLFHSSGRCLSCRLRNPDGPRPCPHSACIDGELSASVRTGLRAGDRRLFGMCPRNADHVRGIAGKHQSYYLDEGSGIPDDVYTQCDGNTAGGGKIFAFGQPSNPVGWFAKTFDDSHWSHMHVSSLSSPNIVLGRVVVPNLADVDWADRMLEQWGADNPSYQCEVLGKLPEFDSKRVLNELEYAQAVNRHATLADDGDPFVLSVDPASGAEGGDASTICMRRGWKVWPIMSFHGGIDRIVVELAELIQKHRKSRQEIVHLPFDAEGAYGAQMRVALNAMRRRDDFLRPEPLESGTGGPEDVHLLRRAGVQRRRDLYYWCAMLRLKTVAGIVHDEELREELLFGYWEPDQTKGSRLPDKKKYRKQFARSPDKADALCYCLFDGEIPIASRDAAELAAEDARAEARDERAAPAATLDAYAANVERSFDVYGGFEYGRNRRGE